ncbi:MAG: MFS transporter, partial [Pseudomonadota bacterium]
VGLVPVFGLAMPAVQPSQTARAAISVKDIILRNPRISLSMSVAALSQAVMVLLMTPTPLAMVGCGFVETQAADVIRWHVVAMFAPGFFTGWFIARFGAGRIATCGVSLLLVAALTAWIGMELLNFYAALIVLGVGWNFAFVSATHILQSELNDDEAPLLQGANDTILAIASAVASLISGALYMGVGWVGLATFALPVPVVIGFLLLQAQRRTPPSNITVSE